MSKESQLHEASARGEVKTVIELTKSGCDVNKVCDAYSDRLGEIFDQCTPLWAASANGHVEVVDILIKSDADVDKAREIGSVIEGGDGRTPLWIAADRNHVGVIDLLIKAGCDVNKARCSYGDGITPLYAACQKNHIDIVNLLIKGGCDVNKARTDDGSTPLRAASFKGYAEVVRLLIDAGCDVDKATEDDGRTPLWTASCYGHTDVVSLLIRSGCDLEMAPDDGDAPLWQAAQEGHLDIVLLLIKAGCEVDVKRLKGHPILQRAVTHRDVSAAHLLVDAGNDVAKKDEEGKSCLELANAIEDERTRRNMLAALHRKPPKTKIMSEDEWYRRSINIGRDILRVIQEEGLCNKDAAGYTFRAMKMMQKADYATMSREMERAYSMSSRPRGHAVIINIMNYDAKPNKKRNGSEVDVERLKRLFTQLGFQVETWEDCRGDVFTTKIEEERNHEIHRVSDAFFCVLMGHGTAGGKLELSDSSFVDLNEDLVAKFDGENCPALCGKPKVFLFQACRGSGEAWPVEAAASVDTHEQVDDASDSRYFPSAEHNEVHRKADILKIYSTYEGFSAVRRSGSWFIEEFVFICELLAHELDILNLITEANRLLRHRKSYTTGYVQTAQLDSSLRKPLFFFPGYYGDKQEVKKNWLSRVVRKFVRR